MTGFCSRAGVQLHWVEEFEFAVFVTVMTDLDWLVLVPEVEAEALVVVGRDKMLKYFH